MTRTPHSHRAWAAWWCVIAICATLIFVETRNWVGAVAIALSFVSGAWKLVDADDKERGR